MSFAGEVRDELYEGVPKKSCCRRALAAGLLLGAETKDKTVTVRFPSEVLPYASRRKCVPIMRRKFSARSSGGA